VITVVVVIQFLIAVVPTILEVVSVHIDRTPVPRYEASRTGCLAPAAVLILWALYFAVPWLLLTTFGAYRRGPLLLIHEVDPFQQGKGPLVGYLNPRDFFFFLDLDIDVDLHRLLVWALTPPVELVSTETALPVLLLRAITCKMSPFAAIEALLWTGGSSFHEDQHFCWSSVAWDEW
jgi:hypothetical protein